MSTKYIVALELAGTQVRGALASVNNPTGVLPIPVIEDIAIVGAADCVQYGRVQNLINAAENASTVIKELENEVAPDGGSIRRAYVGIGGRSLSSEKVTAAIDLPTEMVITQEVLRDLFIEASKRKAPNKKVLKVLPRKYFVDSQEVTNPIGGLGKSLRGEFTLVTCNPINQRNLDLVLIDRMHLQVEKYIVTPLAIGDMVLAEEEKQRGCVLADIGAQTTTISIYKNRALQYIAVLPIGSHNITRDISMGLNMTMEKAESAKCSIGDAMAEAKGSDETARANSYVAARAYELVINIIANIGYAEYKAEDLPAGFILAGRGSRLTNLDTLLSKQSKMSVRFASIPSNVNFSFDTTGKNVADYLSLVALVSRVSRSSDFAGCVDFVDVPDAQEPQPTEPAISSPYAPSAPAGGPSFTPPAAAPMAPRPNEADDSDDAWGEDDPVPESDAEVKVLIEEPAPTKKPQESSRRGLLNILRDRVKKIMDSDGLDGDSQL